MEDQKDETTPVEENVETRRQMLRKIGFALAAASAAGIPVEALGQTDRMSMSQAPLKLQGAVRTAFTSEQQGSYNVFVAIGKNGKGSAVVVRENDSETTKLVRSQLGAPPARATLVGGIIHVDLGAVASGRCSGNGKGAAIGTFNPGDPGEFKQKLGPLSIR